MPRSANSGFDTERNTFRSAYGETTLDASLLLMAQVGFIAARGSALSSARSRRSSASFWSTASSSATTPHETDDGLAPGEGAFLACSFWLADAYVSIGRQDDADKLFERLLSIRNDLGLLAEEYDTANGRLIGNFPQAFSPCRPDQHRLQPDPRHPPRRAARQGQRLGRSGAGSAQEAAASRQRPRKNGRAGRPPRQASSAFFKSSLTALGLALPPVDFITWPTNQPNSVGLAL